MQNITLSATETAKLLRRHLKQEFPKHKFSVRQSHGCLRVNAKNEIEKSEFDKIIKLADMYGGEGFDGMIDMRYSIYTYLNEEGMACGNKSGGTVNNGGGVVSAYDDIPEEAKTLAKLYTEFVFVEGVR